MITILIDPNIEGQAVMLWGSFRGSTMKVTLELPPDVEAQLREGAARHDADAVRRLLVDAFTPTVEALLRELPARLTDAEFEAIADQLADALTTCCGPHAPALSDYAVSRASIYEDHP